MFGNSKVAHFEKMISELEKINSQHEDRIDNLESQLASCVEALEEVHSKANTHFNYFKKLHHEICDWNIEALIDTSGAATVSYFNGSDKIVFNFEEEDYLMYSQYKNIQSRLVLSQQVRFDIPKSLSPNVKSWIEQIIKDHFEIDVIPMCGGDDLAPNRFSSKDFLLSLEDLRKEDRNELDYLFRKQVDYLESSWKSLKAIQHFKKESLKLIEAIKNSDTNTEMDSDHKIELSPKLLASIDALIQKNNERLSKLPQNEQLAKKILSNISKLFRDCNYEEIIGSVDQLEKLTFEEAEKS